MLNFARIVQLAWCVRRENGECDYKSFYVSGADRRITSKATQIHRITDAKIQREGAVNIVCALEHFLDDCQWLRSVDGVLVAHHLEFDAGILCAELQRIPTLCSSVVKTLAARGVCTMTSAAKRNGVSFAHNGHYCSLSLPNAFNKFVTWSHWNEDAHHDAAYDVRKTLELYDSLFRVPRALR